MVRSSGRPGGTAKVTINALLIGIAGGAASALLYATVTTGGSLVMPLFLASPLPIAIVSLGWGSLSGVVAATLPTASVVVLVTGSVVDATALREACARLPYGARTLAVVAGTGEAPSLRRIGEADVLTLGALEQFPAAARKVLS